MNYNEITGTVIEIAIDIHRKLGPGLLESVYRTVLAHELRKRASLASHSRRLWDDIRLDIGFRADLIINGCVVVETKSVEAIHPVHKKQLQTYLRLTDTRVGLLINFNVELLKEGVTRCVNKLPE